MAGLVPDASVVLASVLPGEVDAARAQGLMDEAARIGVVVPALWPLEAGNALPVRQRPGNLSAVQVQEIVPGLTAFTVEIDATTPASAWREALPLAQRHRLTPYDAACLEPTLRRDAAPARSGTALGEAAARESVRLLDLPA